MNSKSGLGTLLILGLTAIFVGAIVAEVITIPSAEARPKTECPTQAPDVDTLRNPGCGAERYILP